MFGRKMWLEYVDEEIERLNRRIDEWYMEYRKANKKRKSENETVCRGES